MKTLLIDDRYLTKEHIEQLKKIPVEGVDKVTFCTFPISDNSGTKVIDTPKKDEN